ncbi:MAG TPA: transglutaminase-like domain-containing protein [Methanospirillum sp.]|nr:transglutaminase-like domain-containing protein [Methanospirillum sp.]
MITITEKKYATQISSVILIFALFLVPLSSGSVEDQNGSAVSPDELLTMADTAYSGMELLKANELYQKAEDAYIKADDEKGILHARNGVFNTDYIINTEFCYNRSDAYSIVTSEQIRNPGFSALNFSPQMIEDILSDPATEHIIIDNQEKRYFNAFLWNYLGRKGMMKEMNKNQGSTPLYDNLAPFVYVRSHPEGNMPEPEVINYHAQAELSLPHTWIPEHGTLKIWIPTPIETDSQTNVTVAIEPAEWVVRKPDTRGDIGYAYLEVPAELIQDDLNVSCSYDFTSHERRNLIDPKKVGKYDVSDKEYITYTQSSKNQVITPEITGLAQTIIGNETNPYKKAHLLYQYILDTIPYSYVPHGTNIVLGVPESEYVFKNHVGDCGSQAMFFVALCRSVGIPARTVGAMQDISGPDGYHAWAEVNIPGYGWIPVDSSVAQVIDNSFNATVDEISQFHEYYFGNQDPFRYYVQKDSDISVTPEPRYDIDSIVFLQIPIIECNTSASDLEWAYNWTINFTRENIE